MMMSTILQNTGGRGEGQGAGHAQRDTLTFDHDLDFDTRAADAFPGLYTSATLPALTMPPAFTSTRRTEGLWPSWLTMSAPQSTVQATAKLSEWEGTYWCKCICFSNYTILPLLHPETPSKPCLTCTKQWCLDRKLGICKDAVLGDPDPDTATGKEGDVEARCFQRDSPRDQLVVTLFLLIVFGLLVGAAVKNKMNTAGVQVDWNVGTRRWWEAWLPGRQTQPVFDLGSPNNGRQRRRDGYAQLDEEAETPRL